MQRALQACWYCGGTDICIYPCHFSWIPWFQILARTHKSYRLGGFCTTYSLQYIWCVPTLPRSVPVPNLLAHASAQVHRFSQRNPADTAYLCETDVSKPPRPTRIFKGADRRGGSSRNYLEWWFDTKELFRVTVKSWIIYFTTPKIVRVTGTVWIDKGRAEDSFFASKFIRILFLQSHRETDRFFAASGVLSTQSDLGFFHYRRAAFSSIFKSRVGNILVKVVGLRINLNIDGTPITNPVSERSVDSSFLVFSLSSHRYSCISLLFSSCFFDS